MTDIEIARNVKLKPILEIAENIGIQEEEEAPGNEPGDLIRTQPPVRESAAHRGRRPAPYDREEVLLLCHGTRGRGGL